MVDFSIQNRFECLAFVVFDLNGFVLFRPIARLGWQGRGHQTSMCLNVLIMYLVGRRGKEHTALLLLHDDVVYYITLYHRRRLGPITNFK